MRTAALPGSPARGLRPDFALLRPSALLTILNLLANSLEFGLQLDDIVGERRIVCLAPHGVRFAAQFLEQKIEASPDHLAGSRGRENCVELFDVAAQPCDFFVPKISFFRSETPRLSTATDPF